VVTPFPGAIETKPGAATVPFFGIEPAILDPVTGVVRFSSRVIFFYIIIDPGVGCRSWKETMLRACWR